MTKEIFQCHFFDEGNVEVSERLDGEKSALAWATQITQRRLALKPVRNQGLPETFRSGKCRSAGFSVRNVLIFLLLFLSRKKVKKKAEYN
jgi:hypothetical protein